MNKNRIISYLVLLSLFAAAVVTKAWIVTKDRQRVIVTVPSIWQQQGKPVITTRVQRGVVDQYSKVVATPLSQGGYICYVPADQQRIMFQGQMVASSEEAGFVLSVAQEVDRNTGLYPVVLDISGGGLREVEIKTNTIRDALFIPKGALRLEGGAYFVWIVQNSHVEKRFVNLGRVAGSRCEVTQGLEAGDVLVLEGGALLNEGDRVHD